MGPQSPKNKAIAVRASEAQRRDKQKHYHDQGDNRIHSSDRVRSRSRIPSEVESLPYHEEVPRSLQRRRTSSSTHPEGAPISSRTYEENAIDDLSEPEIDEPRRADDFHPSSDLRPSRTAPTPNYSHGVAREQRRAVSNEQSHQLPPLTNSERYHGGPTFPQTHPFQETRRLPGVAYIQGIGSWDLDPVHLPSNEPNYPSQVSPSQTPALVYGPQMGFLNQPPAPQTSHNVSYHPHYWNQFPPSQPVSDSAMASLNSRIAGATLNQSGPATDHLGFDMPDHNATTTTEYRTSPIVVGDVGTTTNIVRKDPVSPDTSREKKDTSLRTSFTSRKKEFFEIGKVFKVWWAEPAGTQSKGATVVTGYRGEGIATKLRWFVIVRSSEYHSVCLPIQTYEGRGVSKPGATKSEHAILYIPNMKPHIRPDEFPSGMELPMKQPICVVPTHYWYKSDPMARVNYGKVYTVEHNVKVEDFGMVWEKHHYLLEASFSETFFPRARISTFPLSQGGYASQQSDFAGIGAHSQDRLNAEENTSLDDSLPLNQNYIPTSANPPTTDAVGTSTYYDDRSTGKDRETDERYLAPEYGPAYATQHQKQYYSPSTDPFTTGYGEALRTPQRPTSSHQGQLDGSYDPSLPLSGPIGPRQGHYQDPYVALPTPQGPIDPLEGQHQASYGSPPSYGDQKRQGRRRKGRKG